MRRNRLLRLTTGAVGILGLAVVAASCGTPTGGALGGGGTSGSRLTVVNTSGSLWTCNYNPFNPNANVDLNLIHEPLYIINPLTGEQQPWLATSYKWSKDKLALTVDLREGVKWNDGKPFTSSDVVFNFQLQQKHPELDLYALWSGDILSDVRAEGKHRVVFEFKQVSTTSLRYIIGLTRMRPEHIWESVAKPVTASRKQDPVGTGPYEIKSCSTQSVTYTKNKDYWQEGKPKVDEVVYPAFNDNPPANRYLRDGKGDWGGQFIPDIDNYWVKHDPEHRKYWYPALSNVSININHTKPMFDDKRVRQALAYAVNRQEVSEKAMYGYQKPASQTGIVDTFSGWRDKDLASKYDYSYNCSKAQGKLEAAGFSKGNDGKYRMPNGKPFQPTLINNAGFTDWVASVKFIKQGMQECGIDLQVKNLAGQQYDTRHDSGQFELAYESVVSGPEPFYELRNYLYGEVSKPIGTRTTRNRGRWHDAKTDKLMEAYDKTVDEKERHQIVSGLQQIMLEEVPFIPVTQNVAWSQTDTTDFTGWPSRDNPYAHPSPYDDNWEVVLLNLKPVESEG